MINGMRTAMPSLQLISTIIVAGAPATLDESYIIGDTLNTKANMGHHTYDSSCSASNPYRCQNLSPYDALPPRRAPITEVLLKFVNVSSEIDSSSDSEASTLDENATRDNATRDSTSNPSDGSSMLLVDSKAVCKDDVRAVVGTVVMATSSLPPCHV